MVLSDDGLSIIVKNGAFNTRVTNKECSVSLGCVGFPKGCTEDDTCQVFATYQVKKNQDVTFTLRGKVPPSHYLALGFSQDIKMGDDLVIYCHNKEWRTRVGISWNTIQRTSIVLDSFDPNIIVNPSFSYYNEILWCEFTLRKETKIQLPYTSHGKDYDLSRPYYLQLARGAMEENNGGGFERKRLKLNQHDRRMTTTEKVFLNRSITPDVQEDNSITIIKIHGSLMVISWMFFADVGTFTAGYFRTRFPENAGLY